WRLKDIHFTLRRGEILGIAGLMGAGRTGLLECLFGSSPERPTGGIPPEGRGGRFSHPAQARQAGHAPGTAERKRVGAFAQMTVRDNITICTLDHAATAGFVNGWRERGMAEETVERFGIRTSGVESAITSLSGGNQQKTILGRWLLTKPKVLLLD